MNPMILAICAAAVVPAVAVAQAPPTPVTPPAAEALPGGPTSVADNSQQRCSSTKTLPNAGTIDAGQTVGQASQPLGDRLAQSDGVLCPPANVDPAMRAPTPQEGNTPVIPPPGSPGGDQSVRPK